MRSPGINGEGELRGQPAKRRKQFGNHLLFASEIRQEHWSSLLKFAKNSKRFQ